MTKLAAVEILLDSSRGVYIPRDAVPILLANGVEITEEQQQTLSDPDNEFYWEAWNEIADNKTIKGDGGEWHLHLDGDLFLVNHQAMTPTEHLNLFGEFPEWYTGEEE